MKHPVRSLLLGFALLSAFSWAPVSSLAQGTAFTYQGRLQDGASPANGSYDLRLGMFNDASAGVGQGGLITNAATLVSNGLFTVTLDFGHQFPGSNRWLELAVRTNGGGAFLTLAPRQLITSVPQAVRALEAAGVPAGTITGAMLADGAVTGGKIAPGAVHQLGASDGSPVAAVQVNADGLVGLGTNAPAAGLHVASSKEVLSLELLSVRKDESGGYTALSGAWDAVAQGNLLAVAGASESGITLLDISNPVGPVLRSQFHDGEGAFTNLAGVLHLAMQNNLLVVPASSDSAVTLINVTDPTNPTKLAELRAAVGGFNALTNVFLVALSGNLLALGGPGGVTLVDVSNPASPVKRAEIVNGVGGFNRISAMESLALDRGLLAIGSSFSDRTITLVDVSNPASPVKRAELIGGTPGYEALGRLTGLALSSNLLAAASQTASAVTLVDVSNPSSPVRRAVLQQGSNTPSLGSVVAVALSGSRMIAGGRGTVSVWDVSNPSSPVEVGVAQNTVAGIQSLGDVWGVAVAGTNFVATSQSGGEVNLFGWRGHGSSLTTLGWVGIGTVRPEAALHVAGDVRVDSSERVELNTSHFEAGSSTLASGFGSTALGNFSTASGHYSTALGYGSTADGLYSTALGGGIATGNRSVAIGNFTRASGSGAVALGNSTMASGQTSTALGNGTSASGNQSLAAGDGSSAGGWASVALGYITHANGNFAFALGAQATAGHDNAYVWNDGSGLFASTAPNQFVVHAGGGVGINTNNPNGAALAVQGDVAINGILSGSGAGLSNLNAAALTGTIASTRLPASPSFAGTVTAATFTGSGAGLSNVAAATLGGLGSAGFWKTNGNSGANPTNGAFLGTADNFPLEFKVNGQRALRLQSSGNSPHGRSPSLIGGHASNSAGSDLIGATVIGGGNSNFPNRVENHYASVLGGLGNRAIGFGSVAMGMESLAAYDGAIAMGQGVQATNYYAVAIGFESVASGYVSTAMGANTLAQGSWSMALGHRAQAMHDGSWVWADSLDQPFTSTGYNQFLIRAAGGVGIGTASPQAPLHVYSANNPAVVRIQSTGTPGFGRVEFLSNPQGDFNEWRPAYIQSTDAGGFTGGLSFVVNGTGAGSKFAEVEAMRIQNGRVGIGTSAPGTFLQVVNATCNGTTWNNASDRNLKEGLAAVDAQAVLEKVAALPIQSWSYTNQPGVRHVGPMAQDFQAAFGLGEDDKHIATVDADGVALAAIQGLNRKVEEKESRIHHLETENTALQQRLEKLERLVQRLAEPKRAAE